MRPPPAFLLSVIAVAFAGVLVAPRHVGAQTPAPFTARDVSVFVLDKYGDKLNDRALVDATLPASISTRRRRAPASDHLAEPMPMGMITLENAPDDAGVDVLISSEGSAFLSSWPTGRVTRNRLLWQNARLGPVDAGSLALAPPTHWLRELRHNASVAHTVKNKPAIGLFYDAEIPQNPSLIVEADKTAYKIYNLGEHPVRDLTLLRPGENGEWTMWSAPHVNGAAAPSAEPDSSEPSPSDDDSLDDLFADPPPADAKEPLKAAPPQAPAMDPEIMRRYGLIPAPAASPSPAKSVPKPAPALPSDPATQAVFPRDKAAGNVPETILATWRESLRDQGFRPLEIAFVSGILAERAFDPEQTTVVYRLDEAQIDRLLPLDIDPAPEILHRACFLILVNADPDLRTHIESLVAKLGHDSWPERVAAQEELRKLIEPAKPVLQDALTNEDLEIVYRAETLLEEAQEEQ